jgi:hypothetical protein
MFRLVQSRFVGVASYVVQFQLFTLFTTTFLYIFSAPFHRANTEEGFNRETDRGEAGNQHHWKCHNLPA